MKSRAYFTPIAPPFQSGHRSSSSVILRQRRLLRGVSILLILCWTIGAIWLINVRRGERSMAEVRERQGAIAALMPAERMICR